MTVRIQHCLRGEVDNGRMAQVIHRLAVLCFGEPPSIEIGPLRNLRHFHSQLSSIPSCHGLREFSEFALEPRLGNRCSARDRIGLGFSRALQQNPQSNSPAPYDHRENPRCQECGHGCKDDWPARSAPGYLGLHRMVSRAMCSYPDNGNRGDEYVGNIFGPRVSDLGCRNGDPEPWFSSAGLELGTAHAILMTGQISDLKYFRLKIFEIRGKA